VGDFDRKTGAWIRDEAKNIKWVAQLGSQSYGNPVIAGGRVFVGTNNGAGYLKRYPSEVDLGCLLSFRESDGQFLWQHSSEKLPTGRVNDWPLQGICCAPLVEGNRLWFVSSRGLVVCLDTEGYYDGEDDGPTTNEWGRLFDVAKNDDPAKDEFAPNIAALNQGKIGEGLSKRFAAAGFPVPVQATVQTVEAGKKWTGQVQIGPARRDFQLLATGPKLGAFKRITADDKTEADTVWSYDMMSEQRVRQHNMCSCSVTALGDTLFVITSNGVDEGHYNIPAPDAPSFMAMDKNTGEVFWTDKSPGTNIVHGQWSSPTVAILGGVPQVLFGGGDGYLYSFRADKGQNGKPELLWKFDCNPKQAKWVLGGAGTRNDIIATPVVHDGLVYLAVGQDPEHGEGIGHLWCIDPTKRGDVSSELAMRVEGDKRVPIPHRRLQAVIPEQGEVAVDNPNSAVVWQFTASDRNGDGKLDFDETMHRTIGTVAIKNDLLFLADFSGLFHCLDAKTGKVHWSHDMLAATWGSPLIVEDHVYIGDEDGDVSVFKLSADPAVAMKKHEEEWVPINADEEGYPPNMGSSVYSTPVVANGVLFISNRERLFAIAAGEKTAP
jgi:outer membrane protein assembly factor BamB